MSEQRGTRYDSLFVTGSRAVFPAEIQEAQGTGEYIPKQGDLVTFPGTNRQVYQIVRVTESQVVYRQLDGHYSDSLRNLRRIGMEAL